jgi:sugar phosphate permease
MNGLLALVSLVLTVASFLMYQRSADNKLWLAGFILFLIGTLVFGGLFLSGRVNKGDDIHITE